MYALPRPHAGFVRHPGGFSGQENSPDVQKLTLINVNSPDRNLEPVYRS